MARRITLTPCTTRFILRAGTTTLGETSRAIVLQEDGYPPVHYIPRADVALQFLVKSDWQTTCPWKGQASYYSVQTDQGVLENAAWSYEAPVAGMEPITGHLSFFPAKVTLTPA
jgi:uncharacterized protein (DUF427 family)